jgi:hypothetical protein
MTFIFFDESTFVPEVKFFKSEYLIFFADDHFLFVRFSYLKERGENKAKIACLKKVNVKSGKINWKEKEKLSLYFTYKILVYLVRTKGERTAGAMVMWSNIRIGELQKGRK